MDTTTLVFLSIAGFVCLIVVVLLSRAISASQEETQHPHISDSAEIRSLIGLTFTLKEPIVNGEGTIEVNGRTWKVLGNDVPAGTLIRSFGFENEALLVRKGE